MNFTLQKAISKAMEISLANPPKSEEPIRNDPEPVVFARLGVPKRYREAPLMPDYVEDLLKGRNLYIYGKVGTGKTQMACGIIRAYLQAKGSGALYVSSVRLLSELRAAYDSTISELEVLDRYQHVRLLVLDDLGKESPTEWAVERLFQIIDSRYNEELPTIVTTNYSPGELIERLGNRGDYETAAAIVSRLVQGSKKVTLGNQDRRLS